MTEPEEPSRVVLVDLLKRVLVARIRLDAADAFDEGLSTSGKAKSSRA